MRLMSSRDLDNKISQSLLFLYDPLQPFPLKVFGSTHFVYSFWFHTLDKLYVRIQLYPIRIN